MEKSVVVWWLATLVAISVGDKDPGSLVLRAPSSVSPVFSQSVDQLPTGVSTNQQSVYSKGPTLIHSSASASASAGDSGGRTHGSSAGSSWYTPDFSGSQGDITAQQTGFYDTPPAPQPSQPAPQYHPSQSPPADNGYAPSGTPGGPSYTYYYQHYPTSSQQGGGGGGGGGWSGGDDHGGSLIPDFGSIGFPSFGGGAAGIGGAKGVGVVALIAKGILAIKPFLILGLLLLIALPVLFLLLPIPIITITGQPGVSGGRRSARSSQVASYLSTLSGKVLNSEECLERIICKLPQPPEKYQSRVKLLWDEYGHKVVTSGRVVRGLNAYFESSSQKNRNLKCEQRFKCSNKYL